MKTKEQIQWFWEQCGLQYCTPQTGDTTPFIEMPDGVIWGGWNFPIDLNNLFKYAVPLLERKLGYKEAYKLLIRWITEVVGGKDPADSLFRAIYEAFGGE